MESLQALQRGLRSLEELRGIVKTMKSLSAASIRQYEQATAALAGYYQGVERGLQVVLRDGAGGTDHLPGPSGEGPRAVIVFGTDHGLCGRFNEVVVEHALAHLRSLSKPATLSETTPSTEAAPPPRVLAVGARVAASLKHAGVTVAEECFVPGSAAQITETVQRILLRIDAWRTAGEAQTVHIYHNAHSGVRSYDPRTRQLLPVDPDYLAELAQRDWPSNRLPSYAMNRDLLLRRLIYQYLFVTLFRACAESQASEHAGRLVAMQAAERNLNERLEEVTLYFRRARQSVITAELLDLTAGFEATAAGSARA